MSSSSDSVKRDEKKLKESSSSLSSFYKITSNRPVKKEVNTPLSMKTEKSEESPKITLKTLSTPFVIESESSPHVMTRLNSFSPQYSSHSPLCSEISLISRDVTYLGTSSLDSSGRSSPELLSEVILPPSVEPSPLEIAGNNVENRIFETILYIVRCFNDRKQIQRFFNSDQSITPTITEIDKDVFLQIVLAQLIPEQARVLKHREYIENKLIRGDASDIKPYLEALIAGEKDLPAPFSTKMLFNIKSAYLLQSLCESYLFFEFLFSANPERKINDETFTLFKNFNLKNTQVHALYTHITRFLHSKNEIYPLSFDAMCILISLLTGWLEIPEKIDGLVDALAYTHTGHRLLHAMDKPNAVKFLAFLEGTKKIENFFSEMVAILELAKIKRDETKKELAVFANLGEATYFIHSLPKCILIEELLINSSEQERMRFLNVLWNLNLAITDALIFKKIGFVYRLKNMEKEEELVQRIKRCFSFDILTDSAEIQRAFMRNEALITENQKKLQTYSSVLISTKQAKTIQTLRYVISINELKAEWVTYFRAIWALLLEHWDPRKHLFEAITLRDSFKKIMLDKLAGCDSDAHDPKFYQLSMLPKEMTVEILQNSLLTQKYQFYLDKMTICYERINACREKSKKETADPFPKIKGYINFKDLLSLLTPELSEAPALVLGTEFTQLFVQALAEHRVEMNWPEKNHCQLPQMLYIGTDLYVEASEILRKDSVVERSKRSFHLNVDCAKKAILKICEAINFIDHISLPSGSIKDSAVNHNANTPDISPQKIERSNPNSPPSFFAQSSRRVSVAETDLNSKGGSKTLLHRSLPHIFLPPILSSSFSQSNSPRSFGIRLAPGRSSGSNTISPELSKSASAELLSPRVLASPRKK